MPRSHLNENHLNQIGVVSQSSFQQKWGTPRQGLLTPTAVAKITLENLSNIPPLGRVAILWYAHLNGPKFNPLKARIRPPKIRDGSTVGVFATRGVHRPSSIGLSFCTIESIEGNIVTIAGGDMIEGTPVLAMFPHDQKLEHVSVRMPSWTQVRETKVVFGSGVLMGLNLKFQCEKLVHKTVQLIRNILSQDPRSIHSVRKHVDPIYEIDLNVSEDVKLWIIYSYQGESIVVWIVSENRVVEEFRSRSESWLTRLKEKIPMIGSSNSY